MSLRTLGVERFHVLHLHDPEFIRTQEDFAGPESSTAELMRMKEEGFADAVGLAAGAVDVMMPLLRDWDFDVLLTHNRYTLINRNAEEMIDFAIGRGMGVFNAAPFGGGVMAKGTAAVQRYAYREAPADVLASLRRIEEICGRHGVPVGAAALQFSMREARITATVVGVSKPERVRQTLEWATHPIPDAVWDELAKVPYSTGNPQA
jgi:D-threo-aldose 1-dehydrogenase